MIWIKTINAFRGPITRYIIIYCNSNYTIHVRLNIRWLWKKKPSLILYLKCNKIHFIIKEKYMHIKLFTLIQYVYSTYMYAYIFYLYLKLSITLFKIKERTLKKKGYRNIKLFKLLCPICMLFFIFCLFFMR